MINLGNELEQRKAAFEQLQRQEREECSKQAAKIKQFEDSVHEKDEQIVELRNKLATVETAHKEALVAHEGAIATENQLQQQLRDVSAELKTKVNVLSIHLRCPCALTKTCRRCWHRQLPTSLIPPLTSVTTARSRLRCSKRKCWHCRTLARRLISQILYPLILFRTIREDRGATQERNSETRRSLRRRLPSVVPKLSACTPGSSRV